MTYTPKRFFGLGCKPDTKKDQKSFLLHPLMSSMALIAPRSDLRADMPKVRDQGQAGACTGFALTGLFMFLAKKLFGEDYLASALAVYYDERAIEGNTDQDAGAEIADGITVLLQNGAGPETLWPYNIRNLTAKPPADYYNAAKKDLALHSYRVDNTDGTSIRAALTLGLPVIIGFTVYPEMEGLNPTDYLLPMPNPGEEPIGGHAVVICGHDDTRKVYTVQNQWGTDWGNEGFYEMPYDYVHNGDLTQDCHVVDQEEDPSPVPLPPTPVPVPPPTPTPDPVPVPPAPEPTWEQVLAQFMDDITKFFGTHSQVKQIKDTAFQHLRCLRRFE